MNDITESVVVGYEHRDITAGLRQVLQIYLLIQPPTTTDVLASQLQLIQTYMLVRYMLVECNCIQHACCLIAEFKETERCSRPANLVKLLQKKRLAQTCVLVLCHIIKYA